MTKKGRLCIVMEYADGGDVHGEIKKQEGKLLPEPCILSWFVQTCFALVHVHERKVLHRDLKTQNIFLMESGQIKLGDFGIARVLEATKDYAKTMVGTPYYLSPEIIQDKPYAYRSDVWSCGVVLFEMATLQHPFSADSLVVLASKILKEEIPPIDEKYSPKLYALIQRMCLKDAQARPSFREVLRDEFLQPAMSTANDIFKLGVDLSEFAPEKKPAGGEDEGIISRGLLSQPDAGASGRNDDEFDCDSAFSEPEDETEKSVSALKLTGDLRATSSTGIPEDGKATLSFSTKAGALRHYLTENTSEDEFAKVQALIRDASLTSGADMPKAAERLKSEVGELMGTKRGDPLLPMFQLLDFLEGVAAILKDVKNGGTAPPSLPDAFKQKELIMDTFKRWDLNADGVISKDELFRVLTLLGVSATDISTIFSSADTNTDGKIDYSEFVEWLYSGSALSAFNKQLPPQK